MAKEGVFRRGDQLALAAGLLFISAFVACVWWLDRYLPAVDLTEIRRSFWYRWQLKTPDTAARIAVWTLYGLHQFGFWWLIYYAQSRRPSTGTTLHGFNYAAIAFNGIFALLHTVQTWLFYDGLAQDVPEVTSQWSVIFLLVWVLAMENPRRGLIWGKGLPPNRRLIRILHRYHGYYFSWAITYTFWYHPTVATSGHLTGFFYLLMIMLQGSLFFTRVHSNKYWTFLLEMLVLVHGTTVAIMIGQEKWTMFLMGFLGMVVLTQVHAFHRFWKVPVTAVWFGCVFWLYRDKPPAALHELYRIPAAELGLAVLLYLLVLSGLKLSDRLSQAPSGRQKAG